MAINGDSDWTHGLLSFTRDISYGGDTFVGDDDNMFGFDFPDDLSVRSDLIVNFVSNDSENSSGLLKTQ